MSGSDKSVALKVWSEAVGKNMEMFKEGTEMMHMSTRETSLPIKSSLETLSARIDQTETERLKVLAQLQALIVDQFAKYPGQIKSEFAKADKDYASARASGNSNKIDIASGHLRVAEEHMRSAEDVLNKGLGDFELQRVTEMKEFLKRYIRNQIYFHGKAIEGLTAAYQEVVKIDPETEKAVFLRRIRDMEYQDKRNNPAVQAAQQASQQQPSITIPPTPAANLTMTSNKPTPQPTPLQSPMQSPHPIGAR